MANRAKYFNLKNKYKMLKLNKQRIKDSIARRDASEEAKRSAAE